jgi:hypothetical protein
MIFNLRYYPKPTFPKAFPQIIKENHGPSYGIFIAHIKMNNYAHFEFLQ